MAIVQQWQLRAEFAKRLSNLYAAEVPAYGTLMAASHEVNRDILVDRGASAERLGSIERVSAERHGAIRLGTPSEMAKAARVFAAMGMYPVGFYDLRSAATSAVPVVSTAFRPVDPIELDHNPFRVFTSMLVTQDRRFFSADLQTRLSNFLNSRQLFREELLTLADRAVGQHGLSVEDAEQFLSLATAMFKLSREVVDRGWYEELHAVSSVAADIGGVRSTHVNHLTPRVLDIDVLYHRMASRGVIMIDAIQGPPRWEGPDLLLRQTSFRALAEKRVFREADGNTTTGNLRVRFGEVESRGIAATHKGRAVYDQFVADTERAVRERGPVPMNHQARNGIAADIWRRRMPLTETELALGDLAYFTFHVDEISRPRDQAPPVSLRALIEGNWVRTEPMVYEDFLPKSAAGIFQSNLTSHAVKDDSRRGAAIDAAWMEGMLGAQIHDPHDLYAYMRHRSLTAVADKLQIPAGLHIDPDTSHSEGHKA